MLAQQIKKMMKALIAFGKICNFNLKENYQPLPEDETPAISNSTTTCLKKKRSFKAEKYNEPIIYFYL